MLLAVRLIEQVGAYAGIAAIPGLAVLSALYFSQARDVKRLREWAGRAPERASEFAQGGRPQTQAEIAAAAAAEAAKRAQPGAAAPTPAAAGAQAGTAAAAKPVTAGAATPAGGAKPAVATAAAGAAAATAAGPAAATAAGPAAAEAEKTATPDKAATNGEGPSEDAAKPDKPAALTPAAVASAAAAKAPGARTGPPVVAGAKPAAGSTAVRRPIPRVPTAQTSVLGTGAQKREPWYRRVADRLPAGRYIALIVAGALVLGGGAAFGISQLASDDSSGDSSSKASTKDTANEPAKEPDKTKTDEDVKATPQVDPHDVTVTVVNGTTIPNLARDTATKLAGFGFQIGNKVTGTGPLAAAESVVEYKPGAEDEARYVAAKLDINQKQAADSDALAQAGPAQVIVILGADQAPGG